MSVPFRFSGGGVRKHLRTLKLWMLLSTVLMLCGCGPAGSVVSADNPLPQAEEAAMTTAGMDAVAGPSDPGSAEPAASLEDSSVVVLTPVVGGQVAVGGLTAIDTLNPWLAESAASRALVPLVFQSLASPDPNSGSLQPLLASSWLMAADNRSITFTLQPAARWADGSAVTAADVVYSLTAVRDPQLDSLHMPKLVGIDSISASADDRALTVSLTADGDCRLLTALSQAPIVPQGWPLTHSLVFSATGMDMIAGSGPFAIQDVSDGGAVLVRNPDYWGQPAYIERLSYHWYPSASTMLAAMAGGEIEISWLPTADLIHSEREALAALGRLETYPSPESLFVAFNTEDRVLSDVRVRQALSMAVDREKVLTEALAGYGVLNGGALAPGHWAAVDAAGPSDYDPVQAGLLLESAGWEDSDGDGWRDRQGAPLILPVRTNGENPVRLRVAMLVAADYRTVGIRSEVEIVPWQIFVDDLLSHDYHAAVFSWPSALDPDQTSLWSSAENTVDEGLNITSLADVEVDRLLLEARSAPGCRPAERVDLYGQLQTAITSARSADFLLAPFDGLLVNPDVRGIIVGAFGSPFVGTAEWYVVDDG